MSRFARGIKMSRTTISLNAEVETKVKEIQQYLSQKDNKNYSTSKILNMVLVAGIIGSSKLSVYDWAVIKSFITGKKIDLRRIETCDYATNLLISTCSTSG